MDSPKFIEKPELYSLYEKIELYIRSNFPSCGITINNKSVSFGFPGEFSRIFLYQDKEQTSLILKITQDLSQTMGPNNGQLYKIHSMEDVQHIKSGIRVILECKVPKVVISGTKPAEPPQQPPEQSTPPKSPQNNIFKRIFPNR